VDTSSPVAPGVVRDGATSGVDIASTMSNNTLSANWTAGSDPETGITGYRYAIGTSAGGTNTCSWTVLGNVLTVTRNSLSLSAGTTYYFTVRSINGNNLVSAAAINSNGQYVVALDTNDYSPPSNITAVRDGTGAFDWTFTYSSVTLSANWDSSTDPQSGIAKYWYAIGTQQSGAVASNTVPWTDNGQTTMVNASGLSLTAGVTYYVSVKAQNGIGMQSSTTTSNGQYVSMLFSDTTPPVISLVSAQNIIINGATIIWTTNEGSTSQVEYGRTGGYGKQTIEDSVLNTAHSAILADLLPDSLYHFRVISHDAAGNESISADYTFTTLSNISPIDPSIYAYPNPYTFSYGNYVRFRMHDAQGFNVEVYAPNGQLIKRLTGVTNEISWDTKDSNGVRTTENVCYAKLINPGVEEKNIFLLLNVTYYIQAITKVIPAFPPGNYSIAVVDENGELTGQTVTLKIVTEGNMKNFYPNPGKPTTSNPSRFIMNDNAGGEVNIYTLSGRLVKKLTVAPGSGSAPWDGTNTDGEKARQGIYIYRITSNAGGALTGKLALTR